MADPKLGRQKADGERERQMFEPTTEEKAKFLMNLPMVEWNDSQHGYFPETKQEIIEELDAWIEKACRLRAYLDARVQMSGDNSKDHNRAVRRQNGLATKVRRLLGYSYPKSEVMF